MHDKKICTVLVIHPLSKTRDFEREGERGGERERRGAFNLLGSELGFDGKERR